MSDDEVRGDVVWVEAGEVHGRGNHHRAHGAGGRALALVLALTLTLTLALASTLVVTLTLPLTLLTLALPLALTLPLALALARVLPLVVIGREQHLSFVLDSVHGRPHHRCGHET